MALTYEWKLTRIKKTSADGFPNVIISTEWTLTGTDEDQFTGKFLGATPFELHPDSFISYDDLTEEIVLGWIQNVVVDSYSNHVVEQIQKEINGKKNPVQDVDDNNFPWSPPPTANT